VDGISRINGVPILTGTNAAASISTTGVAPRTFVRLATGDVLTAAASSQTGGATLGNLLPSTTEQAVSSATDNTEQATLMGQTVGASLAETGDTVNWRDFTSQAKSTLAAAGYTDAEIKVYLGAVKQTYQQFLALPVSSAVATVSTSAVAPNPSLSSTTVTATSSPVLVIDPTQLPNTDLPASSFAALAQQAYTSAWASAGSGVDIDDLVANTQSEMDNMGYSTDQVDNYMVGLFQAYNAVNEPTTPEVATPDVTPPDISTDGTDSAGTDNYNPENQYDPLLNDGDEDY
jgi:hypothetical protein